MKTPDEIKKGMECCKPRWMGNYWKSCDIQCPYRVEQSFCRSAMQGDALAYIQQLEARVPRWIPVEERLPEKGERVLVTNGPGGGFVCESYLNVSGKWMRAESELVFMTPRSWMPLPKPPQKG